MQLDYYLIANLFYLTSQLTYISLSIYPHV